MRTPGFSRPARGHRASRSVRCCPELGAGKPPHAGKLQNRGRETSWRPSFARANVSCFKRSRALAARFSATTSSSSISDTSLCEARFAASAGSTTSRRSVRFSAPATRLTHRPAFPRGGPALERAASPFSVKQIRERPQQRHAQLAEPGLRLQIRPLRGEVPDVRAQPRAVLVLGAQDLERRPRPPGAARFRAAAPARRRVAAEQRRGAHAHGGARAAATCSACSSPPCPPAPAPGGRRSLVVNSERGKAWSATRAHALRRAWNAYACPSANCATGEPHRARRTPTMGGAGGARGPVSLFARHALAHRLHLLARNAELPDYQRAVAGDGHQRGRRRGADQGGALREHQRGIARLPAGVYRARCRSRRTRRRTASSRRCASRARRGTGPSTAPSRPRSRPRRSASPRCAPPVVGPRRENPPASASSAAASGEGSDSPPSSWQCSVGSGAIAGSGAAPAAMGASIIKVGGASAGVPLRVLPGAAPRRCRRAPNRRRGKPTPPKPPPGTVWTRLLVSPMGVGSRRRLPSVLAPGARFEWRAAGAGAGPPPCGTGMMRLRPSMPRVSCCIAAVGASAGAPGAPCAGAGTRRRCPSRARLRQCQQPAARALGLFLHRVRVQRAVCDGRRALGCSGDLPGVVAGGGTNPGSDGSSRMGPTRLRRSPYSCGEERARLLLGHGHPQLAGLEREHRHRAVCGARDERVPVRGPARVHDRLREARLDDAHGFRPVRGPDRHLAVLRPARDHRVRRRARRRGSQRLVFFPIGARVVRATSGGEGSAR